MTGDLEGTWEGLVSSKPCNLYTLDLAAIDAADRQGSMDHHVSDLRYPKGIWRNIYMYISTYVTRMPLMMMEIVYSKPTHSSCLEILSPSNPKSPPWSDNLLRNDHQASLANLQSNTVGESM